MWHDLGRHLPLPSSVPEKSSLYTLISVRQYTLLGTLPPVGETVRTPTLQDKSMLSGYRAKDKGAEIHEREL